MERIDLMAQISKMIEKDEKKKAIIYKGLTEEQLKDKRIRYRAIRRYISTLKQIEEREKEKQRKKEKQEWKI